MLTVPDPMSILSLLLLGSSFPHKIVLLGAGAHLVNSPITSEQLLKSLLLAERTYGGRNNAKCLLLNRPSIFWELFIMNKTTERQIWDCKKVQHWSSAK